MLVFLLLTGTGYAEANQIKNLAEDLTKIFVINTIFFKNLFYLSVVSMAFDRFLNLIAFNYPYLLKVEN